MGTEKIDSRQAIYMIILFIVGSAAILPIGGATANDAWIAVAIGMLFSAPIIWMYCRMLFLQPGKNLFEIMEAAFGGVFSKILSVLYLWYFLHLGALVLENFTQYIRIVALDATPVETILYALIIIVIANKLGMEVMGRFTGFYTPIIIIIAVSLLIFLIPKMNISNLFPIMYDGVKPVIKAAFSCMTFPFLETVIFLVVLSSLNQKAAYYKVFFMGFSLGGVFILMSALGGVLILTGEMYKSYTFPADIAVSRLNVGDFLQRLEIVVSTIFLFGGFLKSSLCAYGALQSIKYIFKLKNYRSITMPVVMLMGVTSFILYDNTTQMVDWANNIYPYYALPFQIFIPLLTYTILEIKQIKAKTFKDNPKN